MTTSRAPPPGGSCKCLGVNFNLMFVCHIVFWWLPHCHNSQDFWVNCIHSANLLPIVHADCHIRCAKERSWRLWHVWKLTDKSTFLSFISFELPAQKHLRFVSNFRLFTIVNWLRFHNNYIQITFFMMVQIVNDNGLIPVSQSGTHVRVTPNMRSTINHNKFQKMNPRHIWYELINYKFNMHLQNCNKHTRTFR